ncbi:AN1-type zinc finger protein 2A-like isoform X2 [Aotus nancymaae]|uniref:AN1-type zinc finger protein 2A-like isoform X2 n=1 Tax=Aotus nancymaae TaxID=37293 RepID=UPI0030FE1765
MEFPDLGKYCSEKTCKQLDFLPAKCDMCKQDFCKDHFTYAAHKCPFVSQKDVQVPVCPLCNIAIPIKQGQIPAVVVGDHMDRDCDYCPGKKKEKIFTYRHPLDHSCRHRSRPTIKAG